MHTFLKIENALFSFHTLFVILLTILSVVLIYVIHSYVMNRKKKRLEYALLAFQSHTNPHFIKNVLQAINWFILNNDKEQASDYLCDFSRLMEEILNFSNRKYVSLSEKLEFLDLYLKLQHLRHSDKFDYTPLSEGNWSSENIKVSEEINPEVFNIPPLLLHPFIENAIEHGLRPKKTKGEIIITFFYEKNRLICKISDNGIGLKASKKIQQEAQTKRSHLGILNTKKRIEIIKKLYGINIDLKIEELNPGEDEPGTLVTLTFPLPLIFNPKTGMPEKIY